MTIDVDTVLKANRRALQLLDQEFAELSKVNPAVTVDLERARQSLAYSYVVDFDEIPVGTTWTQLYGWVRIDSDSDFILDGIYVNQPLQTNASLEVRTRDINMSITEVNSGRDVTIIGRDTRIVAAGNPVTPQGVSMSVCATFNQLARGRVEMSTEATFPRNALLRVELTAQTAHTLNGTNFMVLHGTKVFGG